MSSIGARTPRSLRIDRVCGIVAALYGPDGSIEPLLRQIVRGPLRPLDMFPAATVSDGGMRGDSQETDDSVGATHLVLVTVAVAEDFEHLPDQRDWEVVSEQLRRAIVGDDYPSCAVARVRFVRDDMAEAVFLSGRVNAVIELEFEFAVFDERIVHDTSAVAAWAD